MAKYSNELVKRICNLIKSDSYTITEICAIVGISERAYYDWQLKYADFADNIKKAKSEFEELLLAEAKKSILKKIRGFEYEETKTVTGKTGNFLGETVAKKFCPPDTAAIIFTLTNKDPENWKNRQNTDLTTGGEKVKFFDFLKSTNVINETED